MAERVKKRIEREKQLRNPHIGTLTLFLSLTQMCHKTIIKMLTEIMKIAINKKILLISTLIVLTLLLNAIYLTENGNILRLNENSTGFTVSEDR